MNVRDIMLPAIGSIGTETGLREASEQLKALDLDPVPVVKDGQVVGLLYERDVDQRAKRDGLATASERVLDVMRTDVLCCLDEQSIPDAIKHIETHMPPQGARRVPVVDARGVLVGLVSLDDLHRRVDSVDEDVSIADGVQSSDQIVTFDDDRVDYMSDSSFPASDPLPPPSSLGTETNKSDPT